MAGIKPDDVDLLMGYDSFTITALLHLEDLGFCAKGEGGAFVESGATAPGGSLPMNTNGGGLSYTHPGMYGMFLITEAVQAAARRGRRAAGRRRRDRGRARVGRRAVVHVDRRARHGGGAVTAGGPAGGPAGGMERKRVLEPPVTETTQAVLGRDARATQLLLQWCTAVRRGGVVPARGVPRLLRRHARVEAGVGTRRGLRVHRRDTGRPCRRPSATTRTSSRSSSSTRARAS